MCCVCENEIGLLYESWGNFSENIMLRLLSIKKIKVALYIVYLKYPRKYWKFTRYKYTGRSKRTSTCNHFLRPFRKKDYKNSKILINAKAMFFGMCTQRADSRTFPFLMNFPFFGRKYIFYERFCLLILVINLLLLMLNEPL